jgi:hypothetical protein
VKADRIQKPKQIRVVGGHIVATLLLRKRDREKENMQMLRSMKGDVMTTFVNRMILAAKLNVAIYEEVEADRTALPQAMGVVILSSVAAGIGSLGLQPVGFGGIFIGTVSALLGWAVWAGLTYYIGTRIMPEPQTRSDYGELLRTIGFASSPGILRILGIVPGLMGIVFVATGIWMLVATVIAVRQALDYHSTWRAVGVCLIGWLVQAIILSLLFALAGTSAPETAAG